MGKSTLNQITSTYADILSLLIMRARQIYTKNHPQPKDKEQNMPKYDIPTKIEKLVELKF